MKLNLGIGFSEKEARLRLRLLVEMVLPAAWSKRKFQNTFRMCGNQTRVVSSVGFGGKWVGLIIIEDKRWQRRRIHLHGKYYTSAVRSRGRRLLDDCTIANGWQIRIVEENNGQVWEQENGKQCPARSEDSTRGRFENEEEVLVLVLVEGQLRHGLQVNRKQVFHDRLRSTVDSLHFRLKWLLVERHAVQLKAKNDERQYEEKTGLVALLSGVHKLESHLKMRKRERMVYSVCMF